MIARRLAALCLLSALAVTPLVPARAQPKEPGAECGDAGNTREIGECAVRAFKKADTELNRIYQQAIRQIDEGTLPAKNIRKRWKAALRDAQRKWVAFRDADCAGVTQYEWWGGSGSSNAIVFCALEKTNARVRDLKERYDR